MCALIEKSWQRANLRGPVFQQRSARSWPYLYQLSGARRMSGSCPPLQRERQWRAPLRSARAPVNVLHAASVPSSPSPSDARSTSCRPAASPSRAAKPCAPRTSQSVCCRARCVCCRATDHASAQAEDQEDRPALRTRSTMWAFLCSSNFLRAKRKSLERWLEL